MVRLEIPSTWQAEESKSVRRGTCDGRPEAQVPHRAPWVLRECGHLKGCKLARIVVHHGALRPHQVVHEVLVRMAKSEDMPKLVSNDRFKVVALETKLDDVKKDHRANDDEKKQMSMMRRRVRRRTNQQHR